MKIYISGKISDGGKEKSTFDYFNQAEKQLKEQGHEVFNPASLEEKEPRPWEYYISRDVRWIIENRPTMFMLPNWTESLGARLEHQIAKDLELEIIYT